MPGWSRPPPRRRRRFPGRRGGEEGGDPPDHHGGPEYVPEDVARVAKSVGAEVDGEAKGDGGEGEEDVRAAGEVQVGVAMRCEDGREEVLERLDCRGERSGGVSGDWGRAGGLVAIGAFGQVDRHACRSSPS